MKWKNIKTENGVETVPAYWTCTCGQHHSRSMFKVCLKCGDAEAGRPDSTLEALMASGKVISTETKVPFFPGTYETVFDIFHDSCLEGDEALEGMEYGRDFDFDVRRANTDMVQRLNDCMDRYEPFGLLKAEAVGMRSPKQYNFLNDDAEVIIWLDKPAFRRAVRRAVKKASGICQRFFADNFKSRDGFMSFWEHDLRYWQTEAMNISGTSKGGYLAAWGWLTLCYLILEKDMDDTDDLRRSDICDQHMELYYDACEHLSASEYVEGKSPRCKLALHHGLNQLQLAERVLMNLPVGPHDEDGVVLLEHNITRERPPPAWAEAGTKPETYVDETGRPVCFKCLRKDSHRLGDPGFKVYAVMPFEDCVMNGFGDVCIECGAPLCQT